MSEQQRGRKVDSDVDAVIAGDSPTHIATKSCHQRFKMISDLLIVDVDSDANLNPGMMDSLTQTARRLKSEQRGWKVGPEAQRENQQQCLDFKGGKLLNMCVFHVLRSHCVLNLRSHASRCAHVITQRKPKAQHRTKMHFVLNLVKSFLKGPTPKCGVHAFAKMTPVSLGAVRDATGNERKKWDAALRKEYDNLVTQKAFDQINIKQLNREQKVSMTPGSCVLTLT
eukprot:1326357-Amphidinium_carterae.1